MWIRLFNNKQKNRHSHIIMTEKEIRKYINRLNAGKANESIFRRQISANVDNAKVWPEQPKMTDAIVG